MTPSRRWPFGGLSMAVFVAVTLCCSASVGKAATATWANGAATADWFTPANWVRSPVGFPVAGDTIYIGTNTPATAAASGSVVIGSGSAGGAILQLGYAPGTSGALTVQPGAGLTLSGSATLGRQGMGSLIINGGTVSATTINIGSYNGTVSSGVGTLQIINGGVLNTTSSGYSYVGYANAAASAASSVTIDGASSAWNSFGGVIIGEGNNGSAAITVQNGGFLNLTNPSGSGSNQGLGLADSANAIGRLTISGPGSSVVSTPGITVGIEGTGYLSILNGATLKDGDPRYDDYIGYYATMAGARSQGFVVVDGPNSSWTDTARRLIVGATGIGSLTISNGASVTSADGVIGYTCISSGGTLGANAAHGEVLITGPGSIWTTGSLDIAAYNGAEGILTVSEGGTLKTTSSDGIQVGNGGPGVINIGAAQGDPATAPGTLATSSVALGAQGSLVFNHADASGGYLFTPQIAGSGAILQIGPGATNLTGLSGAFSGAASVTNGALLVNAILGDSGSTVAVSSGGILGGNGVIGGNVTIADGNLNPGNAGFGGSTGTLTINGNLALAGASVLNYNFGQAGTVGGTLNDLTVVHGDLTLAGTLNVAASAGGSFDPGIYRVISYDGALTDNGLMLGRMPRSTFSIETAIPGEVDLINAVGSFGFWDGDAGPKSNGVIDGGNGIWRVSSGDTNWTAGNGLVNGPYQNGSFAIFAGAPGVVTVDNSGDGAVVSGGMQFVTSGYVIQGDPITLADGNDIIRVGDGTRLGTASVATIASELTGPGGLDKADAGTLILTAANTYTGGTTISGGTLQLGNGGASGSIPGNVLNDGTLAFNRSDTATFNGVISGVGAVNQIGSGTTVLTGANTYSGQTTVAAGILRAGAVNTLSPNSAVGVAPAATLDLDGFNQTVAGLANSGIINMGTGSAPGTILTVTGNYVGNGGTILLNTRLGTDGSPSDKLVVSGGAATGNTFLRINNVGGLGALTTGNGIQVVQAINGGSTASGAFTLSGRVAAGAYEYQLYRGGVAGAAPDDWYLRSTLEPGPEPAPGLSLPNYRMEVPVYMAAPALAARMGLMMLGAYHDREDEDCGQLPTGELQTTRDGNPWTVAASGDGMTNATMAGWGRVFGETGSVGYQKSSSNFSSNGPSYDYNLGGLQAGVDLLRAEHSGGHRDIAGLYLGMMTGTANVSQVYTGSRAGQVSMTGYSAGGYWTHKGASDWFIDAVLQGTRYADADAHSRLGQKVNPDGWGLAASLEGGYPIPLGKGFVLEPEAQIIYQWTSLNSGSDFYGHVKFADTHEWQGRVGARLAKSWTTGNNKKVGVWARVNVWHSFDSRAKTTFNSFDGENPANFTTKLGGTRGQAGLGIAGKFTPRLSAFATADYNFAMDNGNGHSVSGRIGLRYEF